VADAFASCLYSLTKQLLQDSTPQPLWNPNQKMDHLPLFQLLSYLEVLEGLIHKEFSQISWGTSSMFSNSVVATAHVLRTSSLAEHKTMRFRDTCGPAHTLSEAQGPPQLSQDLPLPLEIVTQCLENETWFHEMEMVPSSTPNQMPPCFKSRTCGIACPTIERGTQTSLPTENQPWPHGLYWKDTNGYDIQKLDTDISIPTGNFSKGTMHRKATMPASILSEHYQMVQNNEEPQNEDNTTNGGEQQGTPSRFLLSQKLTQLQECFPENDNHYCKNKTQLSQPAHPSIFNFKICKCNKMMGSVPLGISVKKDIATCDIHNSIKKGLGPKGLDLPCTSNSSPGKVLKPRKSALKTDKLSHVNPDEHCSCLDSNTERKLTSSIMKLPMKRRKRPYLQILDATDFTPPGVPASNLHQFVFPSSPIYDSKAAMVLENLHHQDPGGTRVESLSDARLESAVSINSLAEVQETQRTPSPAASHRVSETHIDQCQRCLSVPQPAICFQVKPPESKNVPATGTGSLQPSSGTQMAKLPLQKRFQNIESGHCWLGPVIDPEDRVPPLAAKPNNTLEVKEEPTPSWRLSLGSSNTHNDQAISISPREFGSLETKRRPCHLQTPTPQHSQYSGLIPQAYSKFDLISKEQPQPWLVRHDPDGPSTLHIAKAILPSQHSLPIFQTRCQNPKTSQGLCNVFRRRHERVYTQENSVPKDEIKVENVKGVDPREEREGTLRSRAIGQRERLERLRHSIRSYTQLKAAEKTWITEKGEATSQNPWKNITRNALQERNLSTEHTRQGESLKNDQPPLPAEHTKKVPTRKSKIYSMIAELHSLVDILFQILENTGGDPSKFQGCEVESLTSHLRGSSQSCESLYDTNYSRPASRRICGHASPEMHNYPFTYKGIGDKLQSGTEYQRACDQHVNQEKRGMCFDQLHMPTGKEIRCGHIRIGPMQEPAPADQRASGSGRTRIVMGHCAHRSPEGHKYSFRYRKIGETQEPGVDHKAFDPHQSRKKTMGCGCFLSPKENHPIKHRGTDCSALVPTQRDSDPR
jgi:hypothetical protein